MIDPKEIIRNAKNLVDKNDYANAFRLLSLVNPNDLNTSEKIVAYLMLTKCCINFNNLEDALQYCNKVILLSKQIESSFLSREFISIGNVFIRKNRPDQANYLYSFAKKIAPSEDRHQPYMIHLNLSLINSFIDLNKINDAIMVTGEFKYYKNTAFDESISKFSLKIALRFYALKHYHSAASLLSIAMSTADPQNSALYTSICIYQAKTYLKLDIIHEAIELSQMALKKDPDLTVSSFIAQSFINTADNLSINNSKDAAMLYLHAAKLTNDKKLLIHTLMKLSFIYKENKDEKLLTHILMNLSFISKGNKDVRAAIQYSAKALFLFEKRNCKDQTDYKNISLIYSTLKDLHHDSFLYFLFYIGENVFNRSFNNNDSLVNSLQKFAILMVSNIDKNEYQSLKIFLKQILKFILSAYEENHELNMVLEMRLNNRDNLDLLKNLIQQFEGCHTKADNLSGNEQNENHSQAMMPATKKRKFGEYKNTHWKENGEDSNNNNTTLPHCDPTQQTFGSTENRFMPSL